MVKWGSVYILLYLFLSYQIYGTLSHVKLSVMLNSNLHFALISIVYTTLQQYVSKYVGDLWFSLSFKLHQIIENDGLRVCDFHYCLSFTRLLRMMDWGCVIFACHYRVVGLYLMKNCLLFCVHTQSCLILFKPYHIF